LVIILDHTLRDLVFYAVGILINMTINTESRDKCSKLEILPKLVDILRDSNIEDMELAKVSAKALHNMTG
jgi:hypothetical protein